MKKIIRYLLIGVIAAIVFLVASVAIFVAVFDANAYKEDLSDLVRRETGRELVFHGDVDLTIYPALGMKLGALSLSNPEGFGAKPMIKVSQVSVSVDIASLIGLAPEIEKLVMRGLEVNLITDKSGRSNWDDLLAPSAPVGEAQDEAATDTGAATAAAADDESGFTLEGAFAGLDLENIKLLWLDQKAGDRFEIVDLDISTGRIEPNKPFPMKLHLDASGSGDLDVVFDFESDVEYLIEKEHLVLSDIALRLNEFAVSGRVALSDFAKPTPALRFDLESENLDVDALLGTPQAQATAAGGPQKPAAQADSDSATDTRIELPMEILRQLDIDGKFALAKLKVQNLHLQDVDINIAAQNGQVALKPVLASLYGGKSETAIVIDVRGASPRYGVDETLSAVRVGDLLKDFSGEERISGSLDASANLTTHGEWLSALKKNSSGSLKLAFLDGALNGFNLRYSIDSARAKLRGKEPPPEETKKTDFSSLTLSGKVTNGVFTSDDLDLQAPLLRIGGRGSADLNREVVDYLVEAKLVGTVEGQQGKSADQLSGLDIPVSITGAFVDPKIDVLLDEMLKQRAADEKARLKTEIEEQKEKLRLQLEAEKKALSASQKAEKARDKAKKKLEDKLKKLLD